MRFLSYTIDMEVKHMEILAHEASGDKILLTNDCCPNAAMKNVFQTQFFTCTLRRIELYNQHLMQYTVESAARFLLLHLTIYNHTNEILSMFREDFYLRYDGEGTEAEEFFHVPHQFPDTYALKPNEEQRGCLAFIIAADTKRIVFSYTEYFDDDAEGKTYRLKYDIQQSYSR